MTSTRITRTGIRHAIVSPQPPQIVDLLADPAFVTRALGDLLDQDRSRGVDPVSWALPQIHVGALRVDVVLLPEFLVVDGVAHSVSITAGASPESDTDASIMLRGTAEALSTSSRLTTEWSLSLAIPLPRAVVRLARHSLDRAIEDRVDEITGRLADGIDRA